MNWEKELNELMKEYAETIKRYVIDGISFDRAVYITRSESCLTDKVWAEIIKMAK